MFIRDKTLTTESDKVVCKHVGRLSVIKPPFMVMQHANLDANLKSRLAPPPHIVRVVKPLF